MEQQILIGIRKLQEIIWGPPLLVLLLGTGVYLMILLRGLPVRRLGWAVRMALGIGRKREETAQTGGITPFASLATELAATIGTGNIVGVVGAMTLGGPGALVWMVLSGILGLATKLVESSLSVRYRIRNREGEPAGGPMITLARAFPRPKTGKLLGSVYAALAVLCAFGMGNMVQANSIAVSLETSLGVERAKAGLIIAVLTIAVVLGGIRGISRIASYLVPFMGGIYLIGCAGIVLTHLDHLLPALRGIVLGAFHPEAVTGGIFGAVTVGWLEALKWGVSRGVFSNEAGLGAAGISAAATKEAEPVKQGYISMTGVFFDTIVICVVTGITYACSGVAEKVQMGSLALHDGTLVEAMDSAGLMIAAFESSFGSLGGILLSVCITLFAFATILGWAYQGEQAFLFLFGERAGTVFRFAYGLAALLGAVFTLELVWDISDVCNGLLAIPNLVCVLVLAPGICQEIRAYTDSDKNGR